jgi:hypothetical protein
MPSTRRRGRALRPGRRVMVIPLRFSEFSNGVGCGCAKSDRTCDFHELVRDGFKFIIGELVIRKYSAARRLVLPAA